MPRRDPFDRFEAYVRQRFGDDPHVWARVLSDEVTALGYNRAYATFTRQLRGPGLSEARTLRIRT